MYKKQINRNKKKIVLCHGVFDLVHTGHVSYLKKAKELGNHLIVSVTSDKHVNKGPGRPVFNTQQRISFLTELKFIDEVHESNNPTAVEIIKKIKPNFYCKGIDYPLSKIIDDQNLKNEISAVKKNKGKFVVISERKFSSSKLINDNDLNNLNDKCKDFLKSIRTTKSLNQINLDLKKLNNLKVLVIGEMIIDDYIFINPVGKSGKEPILIYKKDNQNKFIGGSGYISNLVSSFAKSVDLISLIGEKKEDLNFIKKNLNKNVKFTFEKKENSPTIVKTRYLDAYKNNKIMGIYKLNDEVISKKVEKKLLSKLKKLLKTCDLIVVADYGHGLFSEKIRNELQKFNNKMYLNTQINSFNRGFHTLSNYKKTNALILNESELRYEMKDQNSKLEKLLKKLKKRIKLNHLVVTQGRFGSTHFTNNKKFFCPAFSETALDSTGAGDTYFALTALGIAAKIDFKLVNLISSLASAYSVKNLSNKEYYNLTLLNKHLSHMFK